MKILQKRPATDISRQLTIAYLPEQES